jgi:hypothetical protein
MANQESGPGNRPLEVAETDDEHLVWNEEDKYAGEEWY